MGKGITMRIFEALKNAFKNSGETKNGDNKRKTSINTPVKQTNENANDVNSIQGFTTEVFFETTIDPIYTKPLPNGLLPGEVLLIDWIFGKNENAVFPRYFETEYGIDAKRSLNKLKEEHYVAESSPYESLDSLRVSDLKEVLKTKGLKVGGNKSELLTRIRGNFKEYEVTEFIEHLSLMATDKGQDTLREYYYIVPAHRNNSKDGIYNVANAIRIVNEFDFKPNNGDISWRLFQKAYVEYGENLQYGLMRNVTFNMADQLRKERRYIDALNHYFRVFILDSSGLRNSRQVGHPNLMTFSMPVASRIKKLIEHLELDEKGVFELFLTSWDKIIGELLFHYLTFEECFTCLTYALADEEDNIKELMFKAYKRLEENYDSDTFRNEFKVNFPVDYQEIYKDV